MKNYSLRLRDKFNSYILVTSNKQQKGHLLKRKTVMRTDVDSEPRGVSFIGPDKKDEPNNTSMLGPFFSSTIHYPQIIKVRNVKLEFRIRVVSYENIFVQLVGLQHYFACIKSYNVTKLSIKIFLHKDLP